ncbi:disulfide bond formation protein DsbA [Candidatus Roizmanbacteria bacterium CG10_big_fil_rev_8_21_14_0_10_45_7]|uniref:Disulfide bond formation protein DsbA n=1 Tax=Candidatus Roizmanbacteria bacterium CG10_big_fil_rev_8_21_14_0_10_45_7 TaxID=1974854 RepID=A0A2M8KU69_9BACT|nr:MAG: disulfide bond formation protein DsbA [Candidatus Roizmanbacteria bacterium CG10_big_fil_rev_8_21_14_0_10_45_7]
MNSETKTLVGIGTITLAILVGVIYAVSLFSNKVVEPKKVDTSLLIRPNSNSIRVKNAPVTLVEFTDLQCPACGAAYPIVKQILKDNKGKITFVARNFPLVNTHKNAFPAALAAEAAGAQGKYWEMYDKLYETQNAWSDSTDLRAVFIGYAQELKLNEEQFITDFDEQKFKEKINTDMADGNAVGVNATPTFFINGVKFEGSYNELSEAINQIISAN